MITSKMGMKVARAFNMPYFETSAMTDLGVDHMFQSAMQLVYLRELTVSRPIATEDRTPDASFAENYRPSTASSKSTVSLKSGKHSEKSVKKDRENKKKNCFKKAFSCFFKE